MAITQIIEDKASLKIILEEKRPTQGAVNILRFILFICSVSPFIILLILGLKEELFFGLVIFSLVGYFFLRIYLWNTRGKEIIILDQNELKQEFDYGWFKEEEVNVLNNKDIKIQLVEEGGKIENSKEEILDFDTFEKSIFNIVFYRNEKEYFSIKSKNSVEESREIMNRMIKWLN